VREAAQEERLGSMDGGSPARLTVSVCDPAGCPWVQLVEKMLMGIELPAAARRPRAPAVLRKSLLDTVNFSFFLAMLLLLF